MPERLGVLFWWGMFNELEWRKKLLRGLEGWRKVVTNQCYVLKAQNFIFHLLTNTFSSHDLFPTPFPSHDFIT